MCKQAESKLYRFNPLPDLDNANVGKVIVLPHCNMLVGILQFSFYSERTYHIISPPVLIAVSYTHLDVYKRQLRNLPFPLQPLA